jgi:hypothetical protein
MPTTRLAARLASATCLFAAAVALGACSSAPSEQVSTGDQELYGLGSLATPWSNGVVPVCYVNASGNASLVSQIPGILERTWSQAANITFTNFGTCPLSGNFVSVVFTAGTNGVTSSLGQGTPTVTLISNDASAGLAHFQYEVIHEFGHALGFAHEMKRPDNWVGGNALQCSVPSTASDYPQYSDEPGGLYLTATYDSASIMNYCDPAGNLTTQLSLGDVLGVKQAYGDSGMPVVTSISPDNGPYSGGNVVTITGLNFNTTGGTSVYFGSYAGLNVSCPTTTTCYATSPNSAPSTVHVQVVVAGKGTGVPTCLPGGPGPTGCSLPVTPQDQFTFTSQCIPLSEAEACSVTISGTSYLQGCGTVSNGCGGTLSCGTCGAGQYCSPTDGFNACEALPLCPETCPTGYICEAPNGYPGTCVINHRCPMPEKYCNGKCIAESAYCP